ncbi:MarR family winged helix-turn-helix transcriptional regulator [Spongiactinospora sp. 9N601]|uniref:MarR family winged helix-turn-helix transcriptional regulator n=1 Tax=Spongiactinospora sp. 9N601 TaxID=3375149 RepID=UPI003787AECE
MPFDVVEEAEDAYRSRGVPGPARAATGIAIERAYKLLQAHAQSSLREHNLTWAGWQALMLLSFARHKSLPLSRLAARAGAHPTTITKTIDRLERDGFVRRRGLDGDRRVTVVEITPEGESAQDAVMRMEGESGYGLDALGDDEIATLLALLRKLRLSLGDIWQDDRSPSAHG